MRPYYTNGDYYSGYYSWAVSNDYMITKLRSKPTNMFIYFQGIWNKYDHLFQTQTRPATDQGVSSGIVPRLYLTIFKCIFKSCSCCLKSMSKDIAKIL